jgi:prevent-host-death family protein
MAADAAGAQYNIHDAKTNLSCIIERGEHGEEIIISRAGTPVAKVIPLAPRAMRTRRGSLAGRLVSGFRELPITFHHAIAAGRLPLIHRDPFDRMLVAQAQCEGLTLASRDPHIQRYDVALLPV